MIARLRKHCEKGTDARKQNRSKGQLSQTAYLEHLESRLLLSLSVIEAPYLPQQYDLFLLNGYLTAPSAEAPLDIVQDYLTSHAGELGLGVQEVPHFVVTDQYTDTDTGTTHIYLRQTLNGLEVANANLAANVVKDGRLLNVAGGFVSELTSAAAFAATSTSIVPALSAAQALASVASALGLTASVQSLADNALTMGGQPVSAFSDASLSLDPIPSQLHYVATPDGVKLAWDFVMRTPDGEHWYDLSADATTGAILLAYDWVDYASYNVFALPTENPDDGSRSILTDPQDTTASPYGWHDTNGIAGAEHTDTQGNNVFAQEDTDSNDTGGFRPDGGPGLSFAFPLDLMQDPSQYQSASITNAFYWANALHDVYYHYGFAESAGNFQELNYSGQGKGGDAMRVDVQDGNSSYSTTPKDGDFPRITLAQYVYTTPNRDAGLVGMTITHEYGHGVSNRLVRGPSNVNALDDIQSGAMGEGWSDWWALMFTLKATDKKTDSYGYGTYAYGEPLDTGIGMRRQRYSYDMTGVSPDSCCAHKTSDAVIGDSTARRLNNERRNRLRRRIGSVGRLS
jgi:extracellular elastinolytic metalloproteinase